MENSGGVADLVERLRRHAGGVASARREATVVVMCFGAMMSFLQITTSATALSAMQDDLGVGPATLVWIPSAYTLPLAALVLTASTLGNRYGRRRLFVAGALVMIAGSGVLILGGSLGTAVTGELLAGVGGAFILPNSLAILGDAFTDPHRRTEVITMWAASSGIGLAIGPVVAGVLLDHASWHAVFLPTVVLGLATVIGAGVWVPESRGAAGRLDLPGAALGTLALAAPVYAVIEGANAGATSPRVLIAAAVTVLAAVAFVVVEVRSPAPMLELGLFRSRSFVAVLAVAAVALFGFTGIAIVQALFFQRVQGLSALHMGYRLLVLFGSYIVVAALAGRLVRRLGFKAPMAGGLALAGLACLALLTQHPATAFASVWPYFALFGGGCGLVVSPSTAAALVSVAPDRVGAASGIVNTARQLGSVLGSALLGALLAERLTATLPDRLARHDVPPPLRELVTTAVAEGRTGDQALPAGVRAAIGEAFVSGVDATLVVTAAVFIAGAVIVVAFVRNRPHEDN